MKEVPNALRPLRFAILYGVVNLRMVQEPLAGVDHRHQILSVLPRSTHSQTIRIRQPARLRALVARLSRARFPRSLFRFSQNSCLCGQNLGTDTTASQHNLRCV
ncbi:hypothetical protein CCR95_00085 [Thiocystis minor]|nr:hypothetical protein [Thiocystis minor]